YGTLNQWIINNIKTVPAYLFYYLSYLVLCRIWFFLENYYYGVNAIDNPTDCRNRVCGRFLSHYLAHIVKNQNLLKCTKKKGDINY
ncbi:hypothetical protein, partial [Yersinia rochesterensis]|uniref:hypothetical protein n=1 Tax=Yersinia rochesterensis TaxID=1604335 RepID=UPI001C978E41